MNRYELSAYAIAVSNFLKDNASAGNERFPITVNEWELAAQLDINIYITPSSVIECKKRSKILCQNVQMK